MRIEDGVPRAQTQLPALPAGRDVSSDLPDQEVARTGAETELAAPLSEMLTEGPLSPYRELFEGIDVRHVSPREVIELSQNLYATGILNFDEYSMLAFQPELQPEYAETIGALTGEPAEPDRRRDFVQIWEDRLTFELKYNPIDSRAVARTERILTVLQHLERPVTNLVV